MEALSNIDWTAILTRVFEVSLDQTENIHWDMLFYGIAAMMAGVLVYEVVCLIARKRSIPALRRVLFAAFLAWWIYIVADITILQREVGEQGISLSLFSQEDWFASGSIDRHRLLYVFLNMLLFMPAGFLLSGLMPRGHWFIVVTLVCFLASCCIEATQYFMQLGYLDAEDVAANTAGGFLGYALGWILMFGKEHCVDRVGRGSQRSAAVKSN